MIGFFTQKETQILDRPDGKRLSCISCGLFQGDLSNPKLSVTGKFKKGILNIGEYTTAWDDRKGKQFQSKSDTILYDTYRKLGIDLEEDCLNVTAVMCHPYNHKTGKIRVPTPHEIQCCHLRIIDIIKKHKPKVIVLFGKVALESVIGFRWKNGLGNITKWRGWVIPDQFYNSWVAPVFSPAYVTNQENKAVQLIWEQDLQRALNHVDIPFRKFVEPKITVLEKNLKQLNEIKDGTKCAFDYETTGLKPHRKEQKIICCSIADSSEHVFVFMLLGISEKKLKPFKDFLLNKKIPKVAQNLKYEHTWTLVKYDVEVKGWKHDTMFYTHIFDNRTSITGLKFQSYVCFGIDMYDQDVQAYIKAKEANDLNKMELLVSTQRGKDICLKYCAWDSILELRLAELQKETLKEIE